MARRLLALLVAVALAALAPRPAPAQAPSLGEAQRVWDAFWGRLAAGDVDGAYRYLHSSRLGVPLRYADAELKAVARQMLACRLLAPALAGPDDVLFEARCEHAGETARLLVGFRQEADGAWRLSVI